MSECLPALRPSCSQARALRVSSFLPESLALDLRDLPASAYGFRPPSGTAAGTRCTACHIPSPFPSLPSKGKLLRNRIACTLLSGFSFFFFLKMACSQYVIYHMSGIPVDFSFTTPGVCPPSLSRNHICGCTGGTADLGDAFSVSADLSQNHPCGRTGGTAGLVVCSSVSAPSPKTTCCLRTECTAGLVAGSSVSVFSYNHPLGQT